MQISRRSFLAAPAILQAQPRRPNVLMISVDDWNDWVGALGGHPQVKTPNMDRLAGRGVLFTDAHTAAPICNPSRAALMTGRRPSTSGVYSNEQPWRKAMPDVVTLPQHFRANGYRAMGAGKVFHHGKGYNDPNSWDDYYFWNPSGKANGWFDGYSFPPDPEPKRPVTPMPSVSWRNFDWSPVQVAEQEMPDHKVSTWAGEMLRKDHDKPFFLAAGLFRPHIPWFVPKKFFDMYPLEEVIVPTVKENDLEDLPPIARQIALNEHSRHDLMVSTGNWKKAVQSYLACISFSDAMLGRILDALDSSPHRDNTIVALWSDHGYHLGEKWHWHKQALWNRATHVPFMITAPGLTKAGGRCDRPVGLIDLYPTLADLAGLPPRPGVDGTSLRPLLENPARQWDRPALITYLRGNHALRSERWSYIRYHDGTEELYDRRQDPNEWVNLAGSPAHAEAKREMAKWLPRRDAPDGG
ncbi:MAG: sulfatase [Bryobacteraceae bacterium]|nr:sulfatase [Bryobacteraceae bacterium]